MPIDLPAISGVNIGPVYTPGWCCRSKIKASNSENLVCNHCGLVEMFHNVLAPSPLYHSVFRAPVALGGHHPGLGQSLVGSTSFLVENILRERHPLMVGSPPQAHQHPPPHQQLNTQPHPHLVRSLPGMPHGTHQQQPPPRLPPASPCSPPRGSPSPPGHLSPLPPGADRDKPNDSVLPPVTPYLKFGVSAILSADVSPKNCKYNIASSRETILIK